MEAATFQLFATRKCQVSLFLEIWSINIRILIQIFLQIYPRYFFKVIWSMQPTGHSCNSNKEVSFTAWKCGKFMKIWSEIHPLIILWWGFARHCEPSPQQAWKKQNASRLKNLTCHWSEYTKLPCSLCTGQNYWNNSIYSAGIAVGNGVTGFDLTKMWNLGGWISWNAELGKVWIKPEEIVGVRW